MDARYGLVTMWIQLVGRVLTGLGGRRLPREEVEGWQLLLRRGLAQNGNRGRFEPCGPRSCACRPEVT